MSAASTNARIPRVSASEVNARSWRNMARSTTPRRRPNAR